MRKKMNYQTTPFKIVLNTDNNGAKFQLSSNFGYFCDTLQYSYHDFCLHDNSLYAINIIQK